MQHLAMACLVLAVPYVLAQTQSPVPTRSSRQHFGRFQQEHGGDWIVDWHPATDTPRTIYGTGLKLADWRENSLAEGRRHANRVLVQHAALLGLGMSSFREVIGVCMGCIWLFIFD